MHAHKRLSSRARQGLRPAPKDVFYFQVWANGLNLAPFRHSRCSFTGLWPTFGLDWLESTESIKPHTDLAATIPRCRWRRSRVFSSIWKPVGRLFPHDLSRDRAAGSANFCALFTLTDLGRSNNNNNNNNDSPSSHYQYPLLLNCTTARLCWSLPPAVIGRRKADTWDKLPGHHRAL